jgi:hypothetical protein
MNQQHLKQICRQKQIQVSEITKDKLKKQENNPQITQLSVIPSKYIFTSSPTKCLYLKDYVSPKNILLASQEIVLYHGTSMKSVMNMIEKGVQVSASNGILGQGLYVTPSATEALRWSRGNKHPVIVMFAIRDAPSVTFSCIQLRDQLHRQCAKDCDLYTTIKTNFMDKSQLGYFPHFWQYIITNQDLFTTNKIYIKKIDRIIAPIQQGGCGGA